MKKRNLVMIVVVFVLINTNIHAQWNHYCDFYQGFDVMNGPGIFNDVAFESQDTGMYSFTHYYPYHSIWDTVLITSNGANTWNEVYEDYIWGNPGGAPGHVKIYYSPPNTFFYITLDQWLYISISKTTNYGATWFTYANVGPWDWISEFSSPDSSTFFFVVDGTIPSLIRGINNSMTIVDSFHAYRPGSIYFIDSLKGFIATSDSVNSTVCHSILKTLTGGSSWINSFHDSYFNINKLFFLNNAKGFAVGDNGKVIKTLDSGNTWQYINTNYSNKLNDVLFFDDTLGYVVGNSGLILKTINGGLSWQQEILTPPDTGNVTKIINAPPGSVYALLNDNYNYPELYITYPHSGVGIKKLSSLSSILLSPNPFTTTTTLTLQGTYHNPSLCIYNLLGQEVRSIPIGTNTQVTINREHLPMGMYFYKVIEENKDIIAIGKMIVE